MAPLTCSAMLQCYGAAMGADLSRTLQQIAVRMDQAADRILRDAEGITYRRYRFLYAMDRLNVVSQRDLARWMGLTEPSVSRMVRALVAEGWIESRRSSRWRKPASTRAQRVRKAARSTVRPPARGPIRLVGRRRGGAVRGVPRCRQTHPRAALRATRTMTTWSRSIVTSMDGTRIAVQSAGSGTGVIVVGGALRSAVDYLPFAEFLAATVRGARRRSPRARRQRTARPSVRSPTRGRGPARSQRSQRRAVRVRSQLRRPHCADGGSAHGRPHRGSRCLRAGSFDQRFDSDRLDDSVPAAAGRQRPARRVRLLRSAVGTSSENRAVPSVLVLQTGVAPRGQRREVGTHGRTPGGECRRARGGRSRRQRRRERSDRFAPGCSCSEASAAPTS